MQQNGGIALGHSGEGFKCGLPVGVLVQLTVVTRELVMYGARFVW